jgi:hypothetical protein
MSSTSARVPWTGSQSRAVFGANAIGVLLIVVAEIGSQRTDALMHQIGWLNLAVLGLVVASAADGGLLFFARRAIGRRRLVLVPDIARGISVDETKDRVMGPWVWVQGTQRAHQTGCPLIEGKRTESVDSEQIRSASLRRCEICD